MLMVGAVIVEAQIKVDMMVKSVVKVEVTVESVVKVEVTVELLIEMEVMAESVVRLEVMAELAVKAEATELLGVLGTEARRMVVVELAMAVAPGEVVRQGEEMVTADWQVEVSEKGGEMMTAAQEVEVSHREHREEGMVMVAEPVGGTEMVVPTAGGTGEEEVWVEPREGILGSAAVEGWVGGGVQVEGDMAAAVVAGMEDLVAVGVVGWAEVAVVVSVALAGWVVVDLAEVAAGWVAAADWEKAAVEGLVD